MAAAGLAGVVATCEGGGDLASPPVPTTITITPQTAVLDALGDTAGLVARVLDQHGSPVSGTTVLWSSGDESVATVSTAGLVTATGNGMAVVTARAGGAAGQARAVVEQRVVSLVVVPDSLAFDALGDTVSLVADVRDPNGAAVSGDVVSWSSADSSVAVVSDAGLVTTVGSGSAVVTASAGGFSDQTLVVVEQSVASVVVGPDSLSIDALSDTVSLAAEVLDRNGAVVAGAAVAWSSGDESVATVSAAGLVTTVGNGSAVVTASAGGFSDQALVVVEQRVASVVVGPDSLEFDALGDTASLIANALDANGVLIAGTEVSWSSGDELVATVGVDGVVTAIGNGTVAVTAGVDGVAGEARVVVEQRVASVVAGSGSGSDSLSFYALGDTASLVAKVRDANGALVSGAEVSWSSEDESVATVTASGLVAAVGNGTIAVTASADGVQGTVQVAVKQRAASVVAGSGSGSSSLAFSALGDRASLVAEARDANGALITGAAVSWSSDNEVVATVSGEGVVTAAGPGTAAITASADGATGKVRVVVEQRITSLVVAPDSLAFDALGDTTSVVAEALDANGAPVAGAVVSWSSDESVAAVSAVGLVTAVGNGTAVVTATADGIADQADVAVAQRVASVAVTPALLRFESPGHARQLIAEALDANGTTVSGAEVTWSSGDESVATVGTDGLVTAVGRGATAVTARVEDAAGEARVVVERRVDSVVVTPDSLTLEELGDTVSLAAEALDPNGARVSGVSVTWTSGDESVATVGPDGLVTAASWGATVVTASVEDAAGEARVVVERRVDSVVVTPDSLVLEELGDTVSLAAEALDPNGARVSGVPVAWTSGDESVATVGADGVVTAVGWGATVVAASVEDAAGEARVVVERRVDSVVVTPDSLVLEELGDTVSLAAEALDPNGVRVSGVPVSWTSGDESVATVNPDGLVTAAGHGTAAIIASIEGRQESASVVVDTIPHPDRAGLVRLYNATNGASWRRQTHWLTNAQLNQWYGVGTDTKGRVHSLNLVSNRLTNMIPSELGNLTDLRQLDLRRNGMVGSMPNEMTSLAKLEEILVDAQVCAPQTPAFDSWLSGIDSHNIIYCRVPRPPSDESIAYVVQAVSSTNYPVPLIAGKAALLRVFVTADNPNSVGMPLVRATFYSGGAAVHVAEIPAQPNNPIPDSVDESSLGKSANSEIPGSVLTPGLEMVVEIDPHSALGSSVDLVNRIPDTGRTRLDVRALEVFDLTVIPFLLRSNPDSTLLDITDELDADHELLHLARSILPVGGMEVTVHDPVWTSTNDVFDLVSRVKAMRTTEGGSGYWMGMLRTGPNSPAGVAYVNGTASFARPDDETIAHELGHNLSLDHAPCGGVAGFDPEYPYSNGKIGVWGWAPGSTGLVSPSTPDVMGYCQPRWISDYHFAAAFSHRASTSGASESVPLTADHRSLLLWGGTKADGSVFLNPAFVVDAPPSLPEPGSDYRIIGEAEDGRVLFSRDFAMQEVADSDGRSSFVFALPVASSWAEALARITLTGGGSSATLDRHGTEAGVLLRDPDTGQVRGLLLDVPSDLAAQADWLLPLRTENMDVQISRGVPAVEAWRR